jgi:hypothetical protein
MESPALFPPESAIVVSTNAECRTRRVVAYPMSFAAGTAGEWSENGTEVCGRKTSYYKSGFSCPTGPIVTHSMGKVTPQKPSPCRRILDACGIQRNFRPGRRDTPVIVRSDPNRIVPDTGSPFRRV